MSDRFVDQPDGTGDRQGGKVAPVAEFGRLQNYSILGLFGLYEHNFEVDILEPTMLTGANGTGKSTVLRTINWVSRGDWHSLIKIPFKRIVLEFEKSRILIDKKSQQHLMVELRRPGHKTKVYNYAETGRVHEPDFARFARRAVDLGFSREELAELTLFERDEVVQQWQLKHHRNEPGWISSISKSFPALLVSDQRLAPERRKRPKVRGSGEVFDVVTAIEMAVHNINDEVQKYKSLYGTASQSLDRNFPRRVFTAMNSQRMFGSHRDISREFQELQDLRSSLAVTGLIDAAEVEESISDLPLDNPDSLALISTYLDDTKEKLATFEPLRRRLDPFIEFLRRHYKGKDIRIDQEHGFRISSLRTGEDILPVHLSSGEQQIFVLAHKLLFGSVPGTLVMIDEPELSLHVLWQSSFVEDLTEISEVAGTYFILATHSPTLIAGRTDLRRSLDR
ncbi:AAA family ATPase [Streptomyces sp. b94]|uniref:AAA family ATPase n=1 Tax=Streptomyces sp. b94 TaxID=1827634 RepID=UPI0011814778|nr:AAA family ATPase [Streptomyces sp. b94]